MKHLINKNKYQVFFLFCKARFPFSFALHTWIVINEKGKLTRYEVAHFKQKNHLIKNNWKPFLGVNKFFFYNGLFSKTHLLYYFEDSIGKKFVDIIKKSENNYPYLNKYSLLGPNSNTYTQWVMNQLPNLKLHLPKNAYGKNYLK